MNLIESINKVLHVGDEKVANWVRKTVEQKPGWAHGALNVDRTTKVVVGNPKTAKDREDIHDMNKIYKSVAHQDVEHEGGEDLVDAIIADQEKWIKKEYGPLVAKKANYGWSIEEDDVNPAVSTKVYGHGVLISQASKRGGKLVFDHDFEEA
jgi:hypothetical protein